jgi:hypothetical protein
MSLKELVLDAFQNLQMLNLDPGQESAGSLFNINSE